MMMSTVIFEKKGRLAIIPLNRPDKMNALNSQAVAERIAAIEEIEKNKVKL
jgi:enoyl-CoA hydratase/carnithine racemase